MRNAHGNAVEVCNLEGFGENLFLYCRVLVLNAQAGAAQLWRRNGFSLVNQVCKKNLNVKNLEFSLIF